MSYTIHSFGQCPTPLAWYTSALGLPHGSSPARFLYLPGMRLSLFEVPSPAPAPPPPRITTSVQQCPPNASVVQDRGRYACWLRKYIYCSKKFTRPKRAASPSLLGGSLPCTAACSEEHATSEHACTQRPRNMWYARGYMLLLCSIRRAYGMRHAAHLRAQCVDEHARAERCAAPQHLREKVWMHGCMETADRPGLTKAAGPV